MSWCSWCLGGFSGIPPIQNPKSRIASRLAFTLTEILIVIAIIVLLLGMAVPAFNYMTGARSIAGAENQISAMIARARHEAMTMQRPAGVMFFINPHTERRMMALVEDVGPPATVTASGPLIPEVFLDLIPDRQFLALPTGVEVHVVVNAAIGPDGRRQSDGYIGFNQSIGWPPSSQGQSRIYYGGTILFDGNGRLTSRRYGYLIRDDNGDATGLGQLLYGVRHNLPNGNVPPAPPYFIYPTDFSMGVPARPPRSSFGLALFDLELFLNQEGFDLEDPKFTGGNYNPAEEDWIDENSVPLLVNRYNGTLVRGE